MKRKDPTLREIAAAAVIQLFDIPREHAKLMTADQILSLVHKDHDPVPVEVALSIGWTPDQYNHPTNITLRLIPNHRQKTAKVDIPAIRKSDRIEKATAEARRILLAKSGQEPETVETQPRKLKVKIKSRGFQKPPPGHSTWQKKNRL